MQSGIKSPLDTTHQRTVRAVLHAQEDRLFWPPGEFICPDKNIDAQIFFRLTIYTFVMFIN